MPNINRISNFEQALVLCKNTSDSRIRVGYDVAGDVSTAYLYKVSIFDRLKKDERVHNRQEIGAALSALLERSGGKGSGQAVKLFENDAVKNVLFHYFPSNANTSHEIEHRHDSVVPFDKVEKNIATPLPEDHSFLGRIAKHFKGHVAENNSYSITRQEYSHTKSAERALEQFVTVPIHHAEGSNKTNIKHNGWVVNGDFVHNDLPADITATYTRFVSDKTEQAPTDFPASFTRYSMEDATGNGTTSHKIIKELWAEPSQTPEQTARGVASYTQFVRQGDTNIRSNNTKEFSLQSIPSDPENLIADLSDGKRIIYVKAQVNEHTHVISVPPTGILSRLQWTNDLHRNATVTPANVENIKAKWHKCAFDENNEKIGNWTVCSSPYTLVLNAVKPAKKVAFRDTTDVYTPHQSSPPIETIPSSKRHPLYLLRDAVDVPTALENNDDEAIRQELAALQECRVEDVFRGISLRGARYLQQRNFSEEARATIFESAIKGRQFTETAKELAWNHFQKTVNTLKAFVDIVTPTGIDSFFNSAHFIVSNKVIQQYRQFKLADALQTHLQTLQDCLVQVNGDENHHVQSFAVRYQEAINALNSASDAKQYASAREDLVTLYTEIHNVTLQLNRLLGNEHNEVAKLLGIYDSYNGHETASELEASWRVNQEAGIDDARVQTLGTLFANLNDASEQFQKANVEMQRLHQHISSALEKSYFKTFDDEFAKPNHLLTVRAPVLNVKVIETPVTPIATIAHAESVRSIRQMFEDSSSTAYTRMSKLAQKLNRKLDVDTAPVQTEKLLRATRQTVQTVSNLIDSVAQVPVAPPPPPVAPPPPPVAPPPPPAPPLPTGHGHIHVVAPKTEIFKGVVSAKAGEFDLLGAIQNAKLKKASPEPNPAVKLRALTDQEVFSNALLQAINKRRPAIEDDPI